MAFSSATKPQESAMAKADRNNLRRSGRDENRQQRREQPEVPGASGSGEDESAEAARMNALKRVGKTGKHSSDETPTGKFRAGSLPLMSKPRSLPKATAGDTLGLLGRVIAPTV